MNFDKVRLFLVFILSFGVMSIVICIIHDFKYKHKRGSESFAMMISRMPSVYRAWIMTIFIIHVIVWFIVAYLL